MRAAERKGLKEKKMVIVCGGTMRKKGRENWGVGKEEDFRREVPSSKVLTIRRDLQARRGRLVKMGQERKE